MSPPVQEAAAPLAAPDTTGSAAAQALPAVEAPAQPAPDKTPSRERWGEFPTKERQDVLRGMLEAWEKKQDHEKRTSPFAKFTLTGADVYWLASFAVGHGDVGIGKNALDDNSNLADLSNFHLEYAILLNANLSGANLIRAHLVRANLSEAHLVRAYLSEAHLEGASLNYARLKEARLNEAHLEGADLIKAHLEGAGLWEAHLEGADLREAHLEGADLREAQLTGQVDLREATFDVKTNLAEAHLDAKIQVADVLWNGVPLTRVAWEQVPRLGDEDVARQARKIKVGRKTKDERLKEYEAAARAYRQLAVALRGQGITEVADRFTYRAQIMRRKALWWNMRSNKWSNFFSWFFSFFLAALTGYGFRMWRIIVAYTILILTFAGGYWVLDRHARDPLNFGQALIVSITAFHGRVFSYNPFTLSDPQIVVTAIEAICGLVIEGLFVAMLVQRFFNR